MSQGGPGGGAWPGGPGGPAPGQPLRPTAADPRRTPAPGQPPSWDPTRPTPGFGSGPLGGLPGGGPEPREVGPYRIEGAIARGGMGAVYRAVHAATGRPAALKLILAGQGASAAQRERFDREVRALAAVSHPGIVRILDAGTWQGLPWYAMEVVDGPSLTRAWPDLALDARLRLVAEVARAIAHAHARGYLHRDLKPDNVLLEPGPDGPRARVTDFGLARRVGGEERLTATGAAVGTPHFMAPEQATGQLDRIGPPTDVWALGVLLFQAVTDALPFDGASTLELLSRIVDAPAPRLAAARAAALREAPGAGLVEAAPATLAALERVVARALEKDPARRYPTADALADDVERVRRGEEPLAAGASGVAELLAGRSGRRRALTLLGALGAAALAALALLGAVHGARARRAAQEAAARSASAADLATRLARLQGGQDAAGLAQAVDQAVALAAAGLGGAGSQEEARRPASPAGDAASGAAAAWLAPLLGPLARARADLEAAWLEEGDLDGAATVARWAHQAPWARVGPDAGARAAGRAREALARALTGEDVAPIAGAGPAAGAGEADGPDASGSEGAGGAGSPSPEHGGEARVWEARRLLARGDAQGALARLGPAPGAHVALARGEALAALDRHEEAAAAFEEAAGDRRRRAVTRAREALAWLACAARAPLPPSATTAAARAPAAPAQPGATPAPDLDALADRSFTAAADALAADPREPLAATTLLAVARATGRWQDAAAHVGRVRAPAGPAAGLLEDVRRVVAWQAGGPALAAPLTSPLGALWLADAAAAHGAGAAPAADPDPGPADGEGPLRAPARSRRAEQGLERSCARVMGAARARERGAAGLPDAARAELAALARLFPDGRVRGPEGTAPAPLLARALRDAAWAHLHLGEEDAARRLTRDARRGLPLDLDLAALWARLAHDLEPLRRALALEADLDGPLAQGLALAAWARFRHVDALARERAPDVVSRRADAPAGRARQLLQARLAGDPGVWPARAALADLARLDAATATEGALAPSGGPGPDPGASAAAPGDAAAGLPWADLLARVPELATSVAQRAAAKAAFGGAAIATHEDHERARAARDLDPTWPHGQWQTAIRRGRVEGTLEAGLEWVRFARLRPTYAWRAAQRLRANWRVVGASDPRQDVAQVLAVGPTEPLRHVPAVLEETFGVLYPEADRPRWTRGEPRALRRRLDRLVLRDPRLAGFALVRAHLSERLGLPGAADADLELAATAGDGDRDEAGKDLTYWVEVARLAVTAGTRPEVALEAAEALGPGTPVDSHDRGDMQGFLTQDALLAPLRGQPAFERLRARFGQ